MEIRSGETIAIRSEVERYHEFFLKLEDQLIELEEYVGNKGYFIELPEEIYCQREHLTDEYKKVEPEGKKLLLTQLNQSNDVELSINMKYDLFREQKWTQSADGIEAKIRNSFADTDSEVLLIEEIKENEIIKNGEIPLKITHQLKKPYKMCTGIKFYQSYLYAGKRRKVYFELAEDIVLDGNGNVEINAKAIDESGVAYLQDEERGIYNCPDMNSLMKKIKPIPQYKYIIKFLVVRLGIAGIDLNVVFDELKALKNEGIPRKIEDKISTHLQSILERVCAKFKEEDILIKEKEMLKMIISFSEKILFDKFFFGLKLSEEEVDGILHRILKRRGLNYRKKEEFLCFLTCKAEEEKIFPSNTLRREIYESLLDIYDKLQVGDELQDSEVMYTRVFRDTVLVRIEREEDITDAIMQQKRYMAGTENETVRLVAEELREKVRTLYYEELVDVRNQRRVRHLERDRLYGIGRLQIESDEEFSIQRGDKFYGIYDKKNVELRKGEKIYFVAEESKEAEKTDSNKYVIEELIIKMQTDFIVSAKNEEPVTIAKKNSIISCNDMLNNVVKISHRAIKYQHFETQREVGKNEHISIENIVTFFYGSEGSYVTADLAPQEMHIQEGIFSDILSNYFITPTSWTRFARKPADWQRAVILAFCFFAAVEEAKQKKMRSDLREEIEERIKLFEEKANNSLSGCNLEEIYLGNPYEFLLLHMLYNEDPIAVFRTIWSVVS